MPEGSALTAFKHDLVNMVVISHLFYYCYQHFVVYFKEHKRNEGDDHIHKRWNESMRKKIKSYNDNKVKIEKPIMDYICSLCDYKGIHLFKLKKHERFGCFKWTCRKCKFRSSLKSKFNIHTKETKHEQRAPLDAFSCATCDL